MPNRNKEDLNEHQTDAEMRFILKNVDTDNRNIFMRKSQSICNFVCSLAICLLCYAYVSLKIKTEFLKNEKFINKHYLDTRLYDMMNKNERILMANEMESRLGEIMQKYSKLSSEFQALKKTAPTPLTREKASYVPRVLSFVNFSQLIETNFWLWILWIWRIWNWSIWCRSIWCRSIWICW